MPSTPSPAGAKARLAALRAAQPEAGPLLDLLEAVVDAGADPAWERAAAATVLAPGRDPDQPVLAGATIPLDRERTDAWVRRALTLAGESSPHSASLLNAAASPALDAAGLLRAVIGDDDAVLLAQADALGADPVQYGAAAAFAVMPMMQALRRRWGAMANPAWDSGCCPVCGAWAVIGEQRGPERARRLRCGRCGGDWAYSPMRCFACGETRADLLGALVADGEGGPRRAETCERCACFVKSIATGRGWAGDEIVLADLASLELDVAAIEAGYGRPAAVPRSPAVTVVLVGPG